MGMNYFYTVLGEHSTQIGKKSAGWRFSFRAHPDMELTSRKAWTEFIISTPGVVHNEAGEQIRVEKFLDMVEETKEDLNHREYLEAYPDMRDPILEELLNDRSTVDEEGFDFYNGEFC